MLVAGKKRDLIRLIRTSHTDTFRKTRTFSQGIKISIHTLHHTCKRDMLGSKRRIRRRRGVGLGRDRREGWRGDMRVWTGFGWSRGSTASQATVY
jgi:hypothetical protein